MENKKRRIPGKLNHLIIYCNPNPTSLSAAYKDRISELTEKTHNSLNVRDLYNIGFRPDLSLSDLEFEKEGRVAPEIKVEQDYIEWADLLTFIFPVWWGGMPAVLKGYIDRVFTRGFAYEPDGKRGFRGRLKDKKVVILSNMGYRYDYYKEMGMLDSMRKICELGLFKFCGMEIIEHRFFGRLDLATKKEREGHIETVELIFNKLLPRD